jgi:hypothetical protein
VANAAACRQQSYAQALDAAPGQQDRGRVTLAANTGFRMIVIMPPPPSLPDLCSAFARLFPVDMPHPHPFFDELPLRPIFEDLLNPKEFEGYHANCSLQSQKKPRQY